MSPVSIVLALLGAGILLLAIGCGDEGAPYRPVVHPIEYEPAGEEILLPGAEFIDFKAVDRTTTDYDVTWLRDGTAVAAGPRYRFFPVGYDVDTLVAVVEYPDQTLRRRWRVAVSLPDPVVTFLPAADSLTVIETMTETLTATSNRSLAAVHTWTLDGADAGTDTSLAFLGRAAGTSTVACRVEIEDEVFEKRWKVRTIGLDEIEMPAVQSQRVTLGDLIGEIHVYWEPIDRWYLDIEEYLILVSFDGAVTAQNQDQADVLLRIPSVAHQQSYLETFLVSEHEQLLAGDDAWFCVVGVDTDGNIGPPLESTGIPLPFYWFVEGEIRGIGGEALEGAEIIDSASTFSVRSSADGSYRIGPFPSSREIQLTARKEAVGDDPGYSRCLAPRMTVNDNPRWDAHLIPAWGTDPTCSVYDYQFIRYLRSMTTTLAPRSDRPNLLLLRWQDYPVTVFVPAYISPEGVDMQAISIASVGIWNLLLGETYLQLVDDPAQADVEFRFGVDSDTRFGFVQILEPGGGSAVLGSVIPEKATVTLYNTVQTEEKAEATSLHELGHVLGICTHTSCANSNYLMYANPDMSYEEWPWNAIHRDELRMVRTIRFLPQATDMGNYPLD